MSSPSRSTSTNVESLTPTINNNNTSSTITDLENPIDKQTTKTDENHITTATNQTSNSSIKDGQYADATTAEEEEDKSALAVPAASATAEKPRGVDDNDNNDNEISQDKPKRKLKPGEKWKANEVQVIPKNNMYLVFPALLLSIFLSALDQTIVTIILPDIVSDLDGASAYSWVGSAYLLLAGATSPVYGRLSDLVGPKRLLVFAILVFLLGSGLCGGAKSMIMLAVARGVQGIGGGGIIQLVQISIAHIVPLHKRGNYVGFVGLVWGLASVFGPLVGGVLADNVSWRWAFYINLPIGGAAAVVLFFFLKTNPRPSKSFRQHVAEFDFLGLFLVVAGVALLLLGFNEGEKDWSKPLTISCVCIGLFLLICCSINEIYTTKIPIIPPRIFKTRTTAVILITVFIHSFNLFNGSFYLPLSYEATGSSATMAGIILLPYSLGSSIVSLGSGMIVQRLGDYRQVIWVGWAVSLIGSCLMTLLDASSSTVRRVFFTLISGMGIGAYFQPPLLALQASMPLSQMATATATFGLMRTMGGTLGIAVGGSIYSTELEKRLGKYPDIHYTAEQVRQNVVGLKNVEPPETRDILIDEFLKSIRIIWIVLCPLIALGFILTLFMRKYSLQTNVKKADEEANEEETPSEQVQDQNEQHDQDNNKLDNDGQEEKLATGKSGKSHDDVEKQ